MIVDTGLTGAINYDIILSVMGQLSDGMWENSRAMEKFWRNADVSQATGRVVLNVNTDLYDSGFRGYTQEKVKAWFADKIKRVVYDELGGKQWNRGDKTVLSYLSRGDTPVTVSDAYMAYEILKGRNIAGRYQAPTPTATTESKAAAIVKRMFT